MRFIPLLLSGLSLVASAPLLGRSKYGPPLGGKLAAGLDKTTQLPYVLVEAFKQLEMPKAMASPKLYTHPTGFGHDEQEKLKKQVNTDKSAVDMSAWDYPQIAFMVHHYLDTLKPKLLNGPERVFPLLDTAAGKAEIINGDVQLITDPNQSEADRLQAVKTALARFPDVERNTLGLIMRHFHKIAEFSAKNGATPDFLAVRFAKTLIRCTPAPADDTSNRKRHDQGEATIKYLIVHALELFDNPASLVVESSTTRLKQH